MSDDTIDVTPKKKSHFLIYLLILLLCALGAMRIFTGFVVIQPIGSLPDGITIWYNRTDINLPFITSPDGLSLEKTGSVSLLSRATAMSTILDAIDDKIIFKLPYIKKLYLISTNGQEFES